MEDKIAVFRGKQIRKTIHKDEWWFSITDVVAVLTDSADMKQYIKKMRQRDPELNSYWGTNCTPLELTAPDGKMRETNCANTEGIFRIVQSIPSLKAEPFKRWLAKVGYERIQEIEDPALATKRTRALYKAKGYSDDWVEKRMRGIAIREELTDEWDKRGVKEQNEYAILTAEISKAAFGLTPSQYKKLKGLNRENLRDHFNDLELIFPRLGEAATTKITRIKNKIEALEQSIPILPTHEVPKTAKKDLVSDAQTEQIFNELAKKWKDETVNLSSIQKITSHLAYLQIIGLGPVAIRLILNELKRAPDFWFCALRALTRTNPVPPEMLGDLNAMTKVWLDWGQTHGYP